MDSRIATIARYTLLEARRTRLPVLVLATLGVLATVSFFVESIAVTEGARFQAGVYAASMRLACVLIIGLHVLGSVSREFNDKGLDVLLALDLPRSHYIVGKLAGYLVIAGLIAAIAALPLGGLAGAQAALQWAAALGMELAIVAALALFCIITFNQLVPAACFVTAFYLLARSLTAIQLMSAHPLSGADNPSQQVMQFLVEGLALVMPALDAWTQTAWLVNEPASWTAVMQLAGQSAVYIALLAAAAMFDFHRKNF
jgi:ABC-type transport system involved in multi-copper enzyme maturation permease subunit